MVSAVDVQNLNKRIEAINAQRMKSETRVDMLRKQLDKELEGYSSSFGIDLRDNDFAKTKAKVLAELKKVTGEVQAEYDLKVKIVGYIESGNYDEAYKLLGIKKPVENPVEADVQPVGVTSPKNEGINVPNLSSIQEPIMEEDDAEEDAMEAVVETKPESTATITTGIMLDEVSEEDGEELSLPTPPKVSGTKVQGSGAMSVMMSMEPEDEDGANGQVGEKTSNKTTINVGIQGTGAVSAVGGMEAVEDDIPSFDDEDFGFASVLKGSNFVP